MRILILCGFAGSGKTTLLLQMARYLSQHPGPQTEAAGGIVIWTEEILGKGIDDRVLRGAGFTADILPGDRIEEKIQDFQAEERRKPAWLVIELWGLEDPGALKEKLKKLPGAEPLVVNVVDISRWKRFLVPSKGLLKQQVQGADVILLNKIDLAGPQTVETVMEDIRMFHQDVRCFPVSALHAVDGEIWKQVEEAGL